VLTVELNELKKDGFEEELGMLNCLIDIHEGHNTVKNESSGDDVISEVD
jgi:hypothetical protein